MPPSHSTTPKQSSPCLHQLLMCFVHIWLHNGIFSWETMWNTHRFCISSLCLESLRSYISRLTRTHGLALKVSDKVNELRGLLCWYCQYHATIHHKRNYTSVQTFCLYNVDLQMDQFHNCMIPEQLTNSIHHSVKNW